MHLNSKKNAVEIPSRIIADAIKRNGKVAREHSKGEFYSFHTSQGLLWVRSVAKAPKSLAPVFGRYLAAGENPRPGHQWFATKSGAATRRIEIA